MILANIADPHLSERPGGRLDEWRRVMHWIVDDAAARGVRLFLISGDVTHARSTALERVEWRGWVRRATAVAPVLVISGNHDVPRDLEISDSFATAHPAIVREEPGLVSVAGVSVGCLPDPRRADLVAALLKRGEAVDPDALLTEARRRITGVGELLAGVPAGTPRVVLAHAMMADAVLDNDQPAARGGELLFKNDDFAGVDADLFLFGHVHRGQEWRIGGKPALYAGAPYSTTYGEMGRKRYVVAAWDGARFEVTGVATPATRLVLLVSGWAPSAPALEARFGPEHKTERTPALEDFEGADVRLRVDYPSTAQREHALAAAEPLRATILEAGAVACKVEPRVERAIRMRMPGYSATRTVEDKVTAWWDATGTEPPGQRREQLRALLGELQAKEAAPSAGLPRVARLGWRGMGYLAAPNEIDLAALPPVVAVTGPTGAGKSTLLSMLHVAAFGDSPRGSLDDFARLCATQNPGRAGGVVEADFVTPLERWRIVHDGRDKKVHITRDGAPVAAGGRTWYREWIASRLPTSELIERCLWLPPRSTGIADLRDTPLQALLLAIGGADQLEDLAKLARAKRDVENTTAERAGAEIRALGEADVAAARAALTAAAEALTAAEQAHAEAGEKLAAAQRRSRARSEARDAQATAAALRDRVGVLRAHDGDGRDVRADRAPELPTLRARLDAAKTSVATARSTASSENVTIGDAVREAVEAEAEAARLEASAAAMRHDPGAVAAAEAAEASVPGLEAEETACAARLAQLEETRRAGLAGRVDRLRAGHDEVAQSAEVGQFLPTQAPKTLARIGVVARAVLAGDDAARGDSLDAQVEAARAALAVAKDATAAARKAAAPLLRFRQAATAATAKEETARGLRRRADDLRAKAAAAAGRRAAARYAEREHGLERNQLAAEVKAIEEGVECERARERAAAAAAEVQAQLDVAEPRARAALEAAATLGVDVDADEPAGPFCGVCGDRQPEPPAKRSCRGHEGQWCKPDPALATAGEAAAAAVARAAEKALGDARRAHGRAEGDVAQAERKRGAVEKASATLTQATEKAALWHALARALGRDGAQAFEAELVGHEVAEVATTLLAQGRVPAWSLRFDSLRSPNGGKKQIEQARFVATHLATSTDRDVRVCSGGQEVTLASAVQFGAIAALLARRGVPDGGPLVAVDEPASAVRGPAVEEWIALLRAGAAYVGARTVLLVPPDDPRVADLCDAQIVVEPVSEVESAVRVE